MVLAVDIGNSNIVLGCFEIIKTVLEPNNIDSRNFEGSIISSVVPSVTHTIKDAVLRLTGKNAMVVGPGMKTGLKIMLDNPAQLGSDRVADAVAAINYYPCPLIIIDMGTATTISVIDRDKNFLGGMIIPGLRVSLDSLTNRTSQLPKISLDPPKKIIGSNTVDCMKSGIIYSNASSIDGVIKRIENELGEKCSVISTGGLAHAIIPFCEHDITIDDRLSAGCIINIHYDTQKEIV